MSNLTSALVLSLLVVFPFSQTALGASSEGYTVRDTTSEFNAEDAQFDVEESPFKVSLFDPQSGEDKERLWSQTKLILGLGVGVAGFIATLPEDVSNWGGSDKGLGEQWLDNVTSGPVWDNDDWLINYVGHPYFGGVYYQVARKSGYRPWDSFVYSFLMSTFYWEYGLEAFAETPSYQDLIITPVVGSLYGEWAYQKEKEIRRRGGKVLGSETLGSVSLFFLDPVDSIGTGINHLFGEEVVKAGTVWFSTQPAASRAMGSNVNSDFALNAALYF